MKTTGIVMKRKGKHEAIIDGKPVFIAKESPEKDNYSRKRYCSIYSELEEGEKVFLEHTKYNAASLVTCFNHGDEHWYRQHLMDPTKLCENELTPYQIRVLKETAQNLQNKGKIASRY